MILPRGQTLHFHGRDAAERAGAMALEFGSDAVEVVTKSAERAVVRLLRPAVLVSEDALRVAVQRETAFQARFAE